MHAVDSRSDNAICEAWYSWYKVSCIRLLAYVFNLVRLLGNVLIGILYVHVKSRARLTNWLDSCLPVGHPTVSTYGVESILSNNSMDYARAHFCRLVVIAYHGLTCKSTSAWGSP